ncbi:hypothetical protein GBAR_LOCUS9507, partial [Geodia barretti]
MEKATARTARETVARRDEKTSRAEELQIQVEERRRRAERMREEYQRELAEQGELVTAEFTILTPLSLPFSRRAEEEYEALVRRE